MMTPVVRDYPVQLSPEVQLQVRHIERVGGGPTLVLLHEALGNIALWRGFPEQISEATGLDVLVYERLGYGASTPITLPRPDDYLEQEGRIWLPKLLDALEMEQAILLGHSDGGSVALVGAAVSPRVIGLITMAAHIQVDNLTLAGIRQTLERYQNSDLPERLARYHGDRTDLLFRAWYETWLRDSFQTSFDLTPWLGQIGCPALIMQGQKDSYGLPEQVAEIARGIGQQATPHFIPECGHSPHLEQPEICLEEIRRFILAL
ncbi:alpha/beta fold hydrolase [Nitrincola sp. MINF-07-Sa-05]|uniref:alpha/beta fold hydrolase n=1 Tax=Nitrincola salilacus TaxID=3400273 RepID=UPI003917FDE9